MRSCVTAMERAESFDHLRSEVLFQSSSRRTSARCNWSKKLRQPIGRMLGEYPGKIETFSAEGNFQRAVGHWPVEVAIPGAHELLGIVYDKSGKELTRIAPRLVSVHMEPGY